MTEMSRSELRFIATRIAHQRHRDDPGIINQEVKRTASGKKPVGECGYGCRVKQVKSSVLHV